MRSTAYIDTEAIAQLRRHIQVLRLRALHRRQAGGLCEAKGTLSMGRPAPQRATRAAEIRQHGHTSRPMGQGRDTRTWSPGRTRPCTQTAL